jgi:hypothetical protein
MESITNPKAFKKELFHGITNGDQILLAWRIISK